MLIHTDRVKRSSIEKRVATPMLVLLETCDVTPVAEQLNKIYRGALANFYACVKRGQLEYSLSLRKRMRFTHV